MPARVIARDKHPISRKDIDPCALKVLYRLYRSGHTAYLVGGGVRDLFLGRIPKDFDVVTSARPSQVKKLFRNCRLIGRRFRLAHVHFSAGRLVEVATFRSDPGGMDESDDLLVREDNTFGTPEEDALRRDFTINGLFYDVADFSVIDYVGGVEDVQRGIVRTIRDPWTRFQEDPIRLLRAIKFAARLGFRIEAKTWDALCESREAITKCAPPRVFEDFARLLEEGSACRSLELLEESGLLGLMEPHLDRYLVEAGRGKMVEDHDGELLFRLLEAADEIRAEGRQLSRAVLFAAWIMPLVLEEGLLSGSNPDAIVRKAAHRVLQPIGVSRRDGERVQQILLAQRRLRPKSKKRASAPKAFHQKSYFGESVDLFELFVKASGHWTEELDYWRSFRRQPRAGRDEPSGESSPRKRKRRRVRRRRTE
ncbi:MAG: polynucleotide adenylyltransferase PcnB [Candidatus Eremiobacteraeota bacterium]|nr:polynucleotide adenylyltransferase PcnB [Candidatus Eremiobacteraeota bacterium]